MIKRELKGLLRNPIMILVLVVILLIPSIYTIPFLSSMWDPYGRLSELPVAVVNEDQPVMYNDKMLSVGDDLVKNLKKNDSLKFYFVSAKNAERGLQDCTYYMTITIPNDFSANAATVMNKAPKEMKLQYKTNPGTNYIASKLCSTAIEKIRTSVAEEVSRTYTAAVFDGFDDITSGMDDAASGAGTMLKGEKKLIAGNGELTAGLGTLSTGGTQLFKGASQLTTGLKTYTAGVSSVDTGVDKLGTGALRFKQEVGTGTGQLQKGSADLQKGLSTYTSGVATAKSNMVKLASNNETLNDSLGKLSRSTGTLSKGGAKLYGGLKEMETTVSAKVDDAENADVPKLKQGLNEFGTALGQLDQLVQNYQETASPDIQTELNSAKAALSKLDRSTLDADQQAAVDQIQGQLNAIGQKTGGTSGGSGSLQQIKSISSRLNQEYSGLKTSVFDGTANLIKGYKTIDTTLTDGLIPGAKTLSGGLQQMQSSVDGTLLPSVKAYTAGVSGLSAGLTTLSGKNQELNGGTASMSKGLGTLSKGIDQGTGSMQTGIGQLSSGLNKLTTNSGTLNSGSKALADGAKQVQSGADKLENGSQTLGSGLTSLQSGTSKLKDGIEDGSAQVKDNKANDDSIDMMTDPVQLDGTEEHPVADNGHAMAAYMMSVALWVGALAFCLMYPLTKYRGQLTSGFKWWLSKAAILYPLAIGMALSMLWLMHKFCGFNPTDWKNTIILACIAALAFMSLMYFFNALLGRVGSFIMLVFMIVQLSGSAGTYPIEISGDFVADINPFLPFSYTVAGFRSTISGCEVNLMPCYLMLGLIAVIFTALSIWLFLGRTRKIKAGKRTFHDFIDARGFA